MKVKLFYLFCVLLFITAMTLYIKNKINCENQNGIYARDLMGIWRCITVSDFKEQGAPK